MCTFKMPGWTHWSSWTSKRFEMQVILPDKGLLESVKCLQEGPEPSRTARRPKLRLLDAVREFSLFWPVLLTSYVKFLETLEWAHKCTPTSSVLTRDAAKLKVKRCFRSRGSLLKLRFWLLKTSLPNKRENMPDKKVSVPVNMSAVTEDNIQAYY